MLKRLKFRAEFPDGKVVANDVSFPSGTMALSGPNGAGKSTHLEMVAYALFGVEACRGGADDYKKTEVELTFETRGVEYKVTRLRSNAVLSQAENVICTGTRPVNLMVVELLGYDLKVFNTANSVGQGEIEALSRMKPAERKKLVDDVIGLDSIDATAVWAGNEALNAEKLVEALKRHTLEPERPQEPLGYQSSDLLKEQIEFLKARKAEKDTIKGRLNHVVPQPKEPTQASTLSVEELKLLVDQYNVRASLLKLPEEAPYSEEDLLEMEHRLQAWSRVKNLPPKPDPLGVQELEAELEAYEAWDSEAECPQCGHHFSTQTGQSLVGAPRKPRGTRKDLEKLKAALLAWGDLTPVEDPGYTSADIHRWGLGLQRKQQWQDIDVPDDIVQIYHAQVKYEADLKAYEVLKVKWEAWVQLKADLESRLVELADVEVNLSQLENIYLLATVYERSLRQYEDQKARYDQAKAEVEVAERKADQLRRAQKALRELKLRIKTFLIPSLSRVASALTYKMTEGHPQELTQVVVDEEFNITVDGKPLDVLNGSAKTVVNLAVRIALGQILTNKVFSVLLCDEVDASCDDERAAAIAEALQSLTANIKQILIVSHKNIEADHYLMVNNSHSGGSFS